MGGSSRLRNCRRIIKGEEMINGGDEMLKDELGQPTMKSISHRVKLETKCEGKHFGR
jgi:hypothetical protein